MYVFVEFDPQHPINLKEEFPIGTMTLLLSDLATTPLYKAKLTSMECYNREIEWNYAYFKKVRLAFYRKMKDVKFVLKNVDEDGEITKKVLSHSH